MPAIWGRFSAGGPNDDQGLRQFPGMTPLSRAIPNVGEASTVGQLGARRRRSAGKAAEALVLTAP
jgi:hypothetical protein